MASTNWDKFYDGTQAQQDSWEIVNDTQVMPWYLSLEIALVVIALIALIIFAGGWLKGSKWINKSNPYISGQIYVRTKYQNLVFRAIVIAFSLFFISSFILESLGDIFGYMGDPNNSFTNAQTIGGGSVVGTDSDNYTIGIFSNSVLVYIFSPQAWYFQCFMTAIILGIAMLIKKYKAALIVWPMALVGAMSVFVSKESILDLGSSFEGYEFQRSLIEHLLIMGVPLFIITSQRYSYTISNTLKASAYMFLLQFGIYLIYTFEGWSQNNGIIDMTWSGEFRTIAEFIGYDKEWLVNNFHLFMWCMLVPFGIACMIAIVFIRQFFYHFGNTNANIKKDSNFFINLWNIFVFKITHMWRQWWTEIKVFEVKEFTQGRFIKFFTRAEKQPKVKYALFGSTPKEGQLPDDNNYKISLITKTSKTTKKSKSKK